jgi:hypothetical protein
LIEQVVAEKPLRVDAFIRALDNYFVHALHLAFWIADDISLACSLVHFLPGK